MNSYFVLSLIQSPAGELGAVEDSVRTQEDGIHRNGLLFTWMLLAVGNKDNFLVEVALELARWRRWR